MTTNLLSNDPDVMHEVADDLKDLGEKMAAATTLNYGWESWLQVELALAFRHKYPALQTPGALLREMKVYNDAANKQAIDLWIPGVAATRPNIGIELKTKNNSSNFATEFVKDYINKIHTNGLNAAAKNGLPTRIYGVGITSDINDVKGTIANLKQQAPADALVTGEYAILDDMSDANSKSVYMVYWVRKFA